MGSKCNRKTTAGVSVPVGFRFQPTEEELVNHYLKNKKEDKDFNVDHIIPVIDVCNYDPWDLPALLLKQPDSPHQDMEWFFYNPRDYKYINSTRSNRCTPGGYWKITGKQRVIRARRSRTVIGKKRTLTFYQGRAPNSRKTNWVKHEYDRTENDAVPNPNLAQRDFVLFRLKKKSDKKDASICAVGEPSSYNVSTCEDQAAPDVATGDYSSSTFPSPANTELGVFLQTNGINDDCIDKQSPFGDNIYSVTDNNYFVTDNNDISTCDEGEPHIVTVSDYENEPDDIFRGHPAKDPDPLQLHVTQQSPTYTKLGDFMHIAVSSDEYLKWRSPPFEDNYTYDNELVSYTASGFENQARSNMILKQPCAQLVKDLGYCSSSLQSPIYTKLGSFPHADVYDDNGQVSNTASNFEKLATDKRTSEVCPQPEENLELLFHQPQLEDYTLQPLMNT